MKIAITGAHGFFGKNLQVFLRECGHDNVVLITRETPTESLGALLTDVDFVFHLAGVNRPTDVSEFTSGNVTFTQQLCAALEATGKPVPVLYTSSIQAEKDNPYGNSKREAEEVLAAYSALTGSATHIYRLPNVFGKWARPNYNSAVATFCSRIASGQAVEIHDANASIQLVYIDDVMAAFLKSLEHAGDAELHCVVEPVYHITVGALAAQLTAFRNSRDSHITERVGTGLTRALYATYITYLKNDDFSYPLVQHADARGVFIEMLKTHDSGQFSFFTAHPGITRGGHYHHTKSEKFLVIQGSARFGFRHIITGEQFHLETSGNSPRVVETIPGWSHDITNIGDSEMIVMLWANEIFDRNQPDTVSHAV